MEDNTSPHLSDDLSKWTVIFVLHLWVIIGICIGADCILTLFLISLWLASRRSFSHSKPSIPNIFKEIQEVLIDLKPSEPKPLPQILQKPFAESLPSPILLERQALLLSREDEGSVGINRIHIELAKDHQITYPERSGASSSHGNVAIVIPEVSHIGWGHWFTLRELEMAISMFTNHNVIR